MLMPDNHAQAHLDLADLNERTQAALAPLRLALTQAYAKASVSFTYGSDRSPFMPVFDLTPPDAQAVQQIQEKIQAILQDAWEESLDIKQRCGVLM